MRPALFHHPRCADHFAGPGHPERPERAAAVLRGLEEGGLLAELDRREPQPAALERVLAVHAPEHVRLVEAACARGRALLDQGDTYVCEASLEAALLAAGAALEAAEGVARGRWANAFVVTRPPGHHAERDRPLGFCLFNGVAIAARHLRSELGLERVAIVDWDVHHGNGTQHIFEADPSVFYASLHQYPHYPGTGAASERGIGDGEGATLNCPLPAGSGDAQWLRAFEGLVLPALDAFRPELVLVSCGFDAHRADPLSGTLLSEDAFRRMTRSLAELARRHAQGRLVSILEGGYDLGALAACARAHVEELAESGKIPPAS